MTQLLVKFNKPSRIPTLITPSVNQTLNLNYSIYKENQIYFSKQLQNE